MNKNFRPTRAQILQAMEDQEKGKKLEPEMLKYLEAVDKALDESSINQALAKEIENAKSLAELIDKTLQELSKAPKRALSAIYKNHERAVRMARNIREEREYDERTKKLYEEREKQQFNEKVRKVHVPGTPLNFSIDPLDFLKS